MLGNLAGNLFLGTLLENLFLGTSSWESCLGTSSWRLGEPLGNLLETSWEPLGNLAWEPLGNLLGTLLGNLLLGTLLGNLFLGTWEPLLGILLGKEAPSWEPGSQPCAVRIWLLRPAPGPLLWLKTPSLRCWGKNRCRLHSNYINNDQTPLQPDLKTEQSLDTFRPENDLRSHARVVWLSTVSSAQIQVLNLRATSRSIASMCLRMIDMIESVKAQSRTSSCSCQETQDPLKG